MTSRSELLAQRTVGRPRATMTVPTDPLRDPAALGHDKQTVAQVESTRSSVPESRLSPKCAISANVDRRSWDWAKRSAGAMTFEEESYARASDIVDALLSAAADAGIDLHGVTSRHALRVRVRAAFR